MVLGKLWILGERALMPVRQNNTIDVLCGILKGPPTFYYPKEHTLQGLIDLVYADEQEEYPILRSLLVDNFAFLLSYLLDHWADDLPNTLLVQLTKILSKRCEEKSDTSGVFVSSPKKASDYYTEVVGRRQPILSARS
jgi:hypothetical protein